MDTAILWEYAWVFVLLMTIEGLLSSGNTFIFKKMVEHLPEEKQKKALFYGLAGAVGFRFFSLAAISFLISAWQVQTAAALYLLFTAAHHVAQKQGIHKKRKNAAAGQKESGFWGTVLKVELADAASGFDSILIALVFAIALPETSLSPIGGIDGGQFLLALAGGFAGLFITRLSAPLFTRLIQKKPHLETAGFLLMGWTGVNLAVYIFSYSEFALLPYGLAAVFEWKLIFYTVCILLVLGGWFLPEKKEKQPLQADIHRGQES